MENVRHDASSSIFHGSRSTTIYGGEIASSARDHNRLYNVFNIYQGPPTDPGNESALTGSQNPLALSVDSGQVPSATPQTPGTLPSSVTPEAHASTEEGESHIARYQRHLLAKKHGFPLWAPQPHRGLPLSYRRKGVSVGDVGIITQKGYFDFLFNICLPRGHANNARRLPTNFSPISLLPVDISELRQHDSGSCLLTPSTEKLRGLTFRCNGPEGSILVMPNGAYHEDLLNLQEFKKTAEENAESWYRFAIETCGRDVGNGELRLVTGCDKTNLWGIATYSDCRPGTLTLEAKSLQSPVEYTWEYEGPVEAKAGPNPDESLNAAGGQEYPRHIRNQCTFLRSFTLTLTDNVWKTMISTPIQDSSDSHTSNSRKPWSRLMTIMSRPFFGFGGRGGTINVGNQNLGSKKSTVHPATVINQMLLSQYPNAKVAISHDNEWCAVIREDEMTMPDAPELLRRIRQTFIPHLGEDGTVYLSQKHAPEANPQRQSLSPDGFVTMAHSEGRGKQSEGAPNTVFKENIVLDDEAFVRTPEIEADNQDTSPRSFLQLANALVIGSMITTHIPEDSLDWRDTNINQLHKVGDGYLDLQVDYALVQNSLFPVGGQSSHSSHTLACLKFLPSNLSEHEILANEYLKWIVLNEANRWAQFQSIRNFIWEVLKEYSGSRFPGIQTKAEDIIKFDFCATAAQIVKVFSVQQHWKAFVDPKQPREVHQGIINLLQELLDFQDLESLHPPFLNILLDISESSGPYPFYRLLEGVRVKSIDTGRFGNIWKGQLRGHAVAIKVIRSYNVESAMKEFRREATSWKQPHHPNVLPFLSVPLWDKGLDQQISLVSLWVENGNLTEYHQKDPTADRMPLILDIGVGLE